MKPDALNELLSWLAGVGGMVIFREGDVHVYRGPVHIDRPCRVDPLGALEGALSHARDRWTAEEGSSA